MPTCPDTISKDSLLLLLVVAANLASFLQLVVTLVDRRKSNGLGK